MSRYMIEKGKKTRERILAFIILYMEERGIPPTIREIAEAAGLHTTSSTVSQIKNLEAEGLLERDPEISRGIRIPAKIRSEYLIEYRCLYPFGCKETSPKPGSCRLHGTELVAFVKIGGV